MAKSKDKIEDAELIAFVVKCNGRAVHIRAQDVMFGGDFLAPTPIINCPECGRKHFVKLLETIYKEVNDDSVV